MEESDIIWISFCPKQLEEGNIKDYISDAHDIVEAYKKGDYEDITNVVM